MKNLFVLASLSLAALSLGQSPTYVPGHATKTGKWIEGHWVNHESRRAQTLSDYGLKPFAPLPQLDLTVSSFGSRYVPGRYDLGLGGYVPGHFTHRSGSSLSGGSARVPQFHLGGSADYGSFYRPVGSSLYGPAPRAGIGYRPFYPTSSSLFDTPRPSRRGKKSGFYGL